MKKSLHDHLDVIKNATIDLVNQYESSEAALMIDDVLVTLAVPCTQLDFAKVRLRTRRSFLTRFRNT